MRPEHFATILVRVLGLGLVIFGLTSGLGLLPFFVPETATSGWTSYSPLTTTPASANTSFILHDTYIFTSLLPGIAQTAIGSALILFGRPIGRWLARGLKDDQD